ncbi:hypothetical protein PYW07_014971 [Mythimna separata]|uniref:Gag-like protein n=1 Tax=Mythimna separata TaxID=271217 RepID=A0AAD7YZ42_MYTSE|nr:hypothetical protein PYW07_014971 [Mythimna separata]
MQDVAGTVSLSSSEENFLAPKVPTGRRGRGRAKPSGALASVVARDDRGRYLKCPDSLMASGVSDSDGDMQVERSDTEHPISLISTKAELNAAKREGRKAIVTEEVAEMARLARERRSKTAAATEGLTMAALNRQIMDGVDVIQKVATKSGNLKGTFTRALKEAAESIKEAVQVLLDRTTSEETKKLQEENTRLQSRMEELQNEVAALKADFCQQREGSVPISSVPTRVSLEQDQLNKLASCVSDMMAARLESRIRHAEVDRPPLAANRQTSEEARSWPTLRAKKPTEGIKKVAEGAKKPTEVTKIAAGPSSHGTSHTDTQPAANINAWTTVVGRKKKKKDQKAKTTLEPKERAQGPSASLKSPNIRVPRSAAITLTLQTEAEKRGITYKKILGEAKEKILFSDFGTPAGFRYKTAATGAKMQREGRCSGHQASSCPQPGGSQGIQAHQNG